MLKINFQSRSNLFVCGTRKEANASEEIRNLCLVKMNTLVVDL